MSSLYKSNYQLRSHKRDSFIEFIKSLLLTPFVLHTRPRKQITNSSDALLSPVDETVNSNQVNEKTLQTSSTTDSLYSLAMGNNNLTTDSTSTTSLTTTSPTKRPLSLPHLQRTITDPEAQFPTDDDPKDINEARFLDIFTCLEDLIQDHSLHQSRQCPELSRLSQLVPTIGRFFTPLPLAESFRINNRRRSIASRRFVPPSFNDVRHILNTAQVLAIIPSLKLVTFDGDQTLYSDGANFSDNRLVKLLIQLLSQDIFVALVTAAGYAGAEGAERYEKRLTALMEGLKTSGLPPSKLEKFYVMGGECNYLFRYVPSSGKLQFLKENTYQPEHIRSWATNSKRVQELLDIAQSSLEKVISELSLSTRCKILRKDRAVGVIPLDPISSPLAREQLDEFALTVQKRLNSFQEYQKILHPHLFPIPFCAFNGGADVFVDIGNKLIGVQILQELLGLKDGAETLHVGDQFLSTGNDIATRTCCCTVWISNPEETVQVLNELLPLLEKRSLSN